MSLVALVLLLALPRVDYTDDAGRVRSTDGWKGAPTILVPMYTRCPSTCALITEAVKRAVDASTAAPNSYRVVLFSFDSRDTSEDLSAYRERHRLPLSWTLASSSPESVRLLMDSVQYPYTTADGGFAHPNQVIILSPDLTVATRLLGTSFSGSQIDSALAIAHGSRDWLTDFGAYALAGLLLLCTLTAVYLAGLMMLP